MWRKIKLAKDEAPRDAFVTIGNGQIHFGITACKLMPECLDKQYVEFFRSEEENLVGVCIVDNPSEDSVQISRPASKSPKKQNQNVSSFTVVSKQAMYRVFGEAGIASDSIKCKVTLDPDTYGMFVIDMNEFRAAKAKKERDVES